MRGSCFKLLIAKCLLAAFVCAAKDRWNNPPKRVPPDIQHKTFSSASLKTAVGYNICLPPQYSKNPAQRFPVIYYLHGYDGNESSYLDYAKYWQDAVKRSGPVILVFVNGGGNSFFCDSPDGSVPGESLLVKELVPHIDQKFRTITNASGRSLHGYSMGGFGALKLALKFPATFGSCVAYGATLSDAVEFRNHLDDVYKTMFGGDAQRFAANDPFTLAERDVDATHNRAAICIFVGSRDEFLDRNRMFHEKLLQLKIAHEYEEIRGAGHDKGDLYEATARRAFDFSSRHFGGERSGK